MHSQSTDPRIGLVLVGFSPAERLAALARHLRWPGQVLSDPPRQLYTAVGIGRAPLWRLYTRRTLLTYGRALLHGHRVKQPVEDTRQLGGDALVVDGTVRRLWRPRSPDDRPEARTVLAAASALLDG